MSSQTAITLITGTDTGVGKTVLTALLLDHLRRRGVHALAMKPFCSGGTGDVEMLDAVQEGELEAKLINPFYFEQPVAPMVGARMQRRRIGLPAVLRAIRRVARRCEHLLIEGSGGLMVPLGEDFAVVDLVPRLACSVVVVARNRLGTINHTLLTVKALRSIGVERPVVVLMSCASALAQSDVSAATNLEVIREWIAPAKALELPFLGRNPGKMRAIKENRKKIQKTLAQILDFVIVPPTFFASK